MLLLHLIDMIAALTLLFLFSSSSSSLCSLHPSVYNIHYVLYRYDLPGYGTLDKYRKRDKENRKDKKDEEVNNWDGIPGSTNKERFHLWCMTIFEGEPYPAPLPVRCLVLCV